MRGERVDQVLEELAVMWFLGKLHQEVLCFGNNGVNLWD